MAKTIVFCSTPAGEALAASTTSYQQISGEILESTTENNHKYRCRTAGTWSQMYMRVSANAGGAASTYKTRKNGADGGQSITVGSNATGEFEDTSGTDSLDGDDEINYILNSGASAATPTIRFISSIFDATTNTVSLLGFRMGTALTTASTTFFRGLSMGISATNPTEANANCEQRQAGTMKNIGVFVSANARTATTFKSRKNVGDGGMSVSITASGTGWFQDTTGTDTIAANDDWCFAFVHGTGTDSCTYQVFKVEFETTDGDGQIVIGANTAVGYVDNATRHVPIGGFLEVGDTASTQMLAETNVAIDFIEMSVEVPTNTASNTSTITLQKDGVDTSLVVSVTADATGVFTTAATVSFTATEETSIEITVPTEGGTNTLSIQSISLWTHIVASTAFERAPATETVTISDTVARVYGQVRTIETETVTSSESITRMLAATRNPIETTDSTETLVRLLTAQRIIDPETTAISDSVTRVKGIPRSIDTETVTISDDLQRMLTANRTLQEDTVISETLTRLLAANRSLATETVNITDQVQRIVGVVRTLETETVTSSDSVQRLLAATRTIETESTVISDSVARLLAATRAILETTTITDSVVGLQQGPGQQNLERSITETVVISESIARMLAATRTIVSETVTVNDTLNRQLNASRLVDTEVTAITDSVARVYGAVRSIVTETTAVTDSVVRSVGRVRTLTENVNVSDSVARLLAATRLMLEQVSQLDSLDRLLSASRSLPTETMTVSDSITRIITRVRTIVENIDINDAITRAFVGARPILEVVNITDSLTRLLIPFEIPTRLRKLKNYIIAKYTASGVDPTL